ncbi:ribosomal protein S6 kinase delta-1 isoform X2 [Anoplophora glabripennis]|uniref:ribosomal protein S6 kinase delta-1 isoform X2 n=1 Tax=Anoplophora glabripennis TaxID=217634 RepID=UPI0008748B8A|nr:ribosomal protein S6 kinase delta-1 isoform X2 [Anoplophora glabripennis]
MVSTHENWIRIFDIPDISKHKNGFTIYKVVSMLYPESCPDAVTKVTVWKRFNDFKKLHRDLKVLHRRLSLKNKYPPLPTRALFKRFDEETIKERRQGILNFLEYIGSVSQLFTSTEFVKFLETSHTPVEHLHSNINTIRAELNLPEDPEPDFFPETLSHNLPHSNLKKLSSCLSINSQTSSKNSDSLSVTTMLDNLTLIDGQIYPTPPNTPGSLVASGCMQYIIDASVHINLATELENSKKYEEAFAAYETAIDILLKYGKDDPNYNHRQMVRYKANKYLIRAEKIFNMYLAPEVKNLQLVEETPEQATTKRPLFDLYKFKVVKIISSGMLVLHSELQQLFYIKVIHKTTEFLNENLVLPENVPYMVKLHYHYNCENALFLVLEYCSGVHLSEYLRRQSTLDEVTTKKENQILKQIHDMSDDNDSELSFSDLINEYTSNRLKNVSVARDLEQKSSSSDDSYVKVDLEDKLPYNNQSTKNSGGKCLKEKDEEFKLLSPLDTTSTEVVQSDDIERGESHKKNVEASEEVHSSQRKDSDLTNFEESFETHSVLAERTIVKWAAQLLLALEKLHVLGVICRDLEIKNLLLDENNNLVLTYMCNVKDLCDLFSNGINHNLAPEVYSHHEITAAVDWWSYGAILYELLVGMPLSEVHPNGLNSFSHLKIPKYVSAEGRSILRQLLIYEPHDRLGTGLNGIENIKSHPFFNSISWDSLISALQ